MDIRIDRELPVPIPIQLQGQIEYGMVNGDFPPGSRLPSVRDLAATLGVSPVTVSSVYGRLAERGLLESRAGRGTFVRAPLDAVTAGPDVHTLEADVSALAARAQRLGVDRAALVELVQRTVASGGDDARALRLLIVGVFDDATRTYASALRASLKRSDRIQATTFARLRDDAGARQALAAPDLVLTFAHREDELTPLLPPDQAVATVALVPSRATRVALAELEPRTRLALVSEFPEFLPTFDRAVRRFASHVAAVTPLLLHDPDLQRGLFDADVVVYGTGSEAVLDQLPGSVRAFEYRHEPDPIQVERKLLPLFARLRAARSARDLRPPPEEPPV